MRLENKSTHQLPQSANQDAAATADSGLSAALKRALGTGRRQEHLGDGPLKAGQEIARRAKAEKPTIKTTPRKAHIGPRSGHK